MFIHIDQVFSASNQSMQYVLRVQKNCKMFTFDKMGDIF